MTETATGTQPWEGWVILELMGHRRLAGHLTEEQIGGASFLRLDVPGPDICERCSGQGGLQETDLDGRPLHTEDPCTACDGYMTRLVASQFYSPTAVYCITPTTEAIARQVAKRLAPAPVHHWELPRAPRHDDEHTV